MASGLRPKALYGWFTPLSSLKGVGPSTLKAFQRLLSQVRGAEPVLTVRDLLFLLPHEVIDRRIVHSVDSAEIGAYTMLEIEVDAHYPPPVKRRSLPYRIAAHDQSGSVLITFFQVKGDYLLRQFPVGATRIIGGVVELYDGHKQISHPDIVLQPSQRAYGLRLSPVYPLTLGISQKILSRFMTDALRLATDLPEWANSALREARGWPSFFNALGRIHSPKKASDISLDGLYRQRLAYDEALANQLALLLLRQQEQAEPSVHVQIDYSIHQRFLQALPFTLTKAQEQVVHDIFADISSGLRMVRLLQGDVGSGKTVVAMAAMVQLANMGYQSALMAPTDILARQHAHTLTPMAEALGLKLQLMTGKMPASERKRAQEAIARGEVHIVVGTHALFQQHMQFTSLGLVVVDEQHRFGVGQRLALAEKSLAPHMLQMTATPIPRSLTMAAYGDMDTSILSEKPAGRQQIDTRAVPIERSDEVLEAVRRAVAAGQKLYWICPFIEASDEADPATDMAAVEDRFRVLHHMFGDKAGMMHGRMKTAEREDVMQQFAFGDMQILVATTVIEVGVNVPEATIMVIEHAERFGLAQLHQLRGRVGRGSEVSRCILLYDTACSAIAKERLKTIRGTNDGFLIAEEDLRLRGAGDVLGTKQTGLPPFHFLNLAVHADMLRTARDDAKYLLASDPHLQSERGEACRLLLALFGYDEEVAALRAA